MIPALGFGTASILGRAGPAESLVALETAYAAGIRHFDTARSYGWGEAEGLLGAFLARVRGERATVVTKCGIVPVPRTAGLAMLKASARRTIGLVPALAPLVRRAAATRAFQPERTYDVAALEASFRTSLAELRRDRVDVLLLHDFAPARDGLEDVARWLISLRDEGKIGEHGFSIEGNLLEGMGHLESCGLLAHAVIQAPIGDTMFALPQRWRAVPIIAHSPFRHMRAMGITGPPDLALEQLLKELGRACRCRALLCSMFDPAHIANNVAAWRRAAAAG